MLGSRSRLLGFRAIAIGSSHLISLDSAVFADAAINTGYQESHLFL
jgi:hypothetical protein